MTFHQRFEGLVGSGGDSADYDRCRCDHLQRV